MNGIYFDRLDQRLQSRFGILVKQHSHAVNAAITGISALPGSAQPFAATRAMTRMLNNDAVPFHALIEPAQDAIHKAVTASTTPYALVVHDWSMFSFNKHTSKQDRYQRSHKDDLGYELGTALVLDAADGRPLGPMELRLRTAEGTLSTRVDDVAMPPGHVDELLDVMRESQRWDFSKTLIHIVDREADSVGHYRDWHADGHQFLVRADINRVLLWKGEECQLAKVLPGLSCQFTDVLNAEGQPEIVTIQAGTGQVRVAETPVILHRPAKKKTGKRTPSGHKQVQSIAGPPIELRLIVTRVVNEVGVVIAEWCLLTNADASIEASMLGRWYAWRWRIETFHKLLKSAGMNAEEWQQQTGSAFLRRLCIVVMSCLTVWHLQREEGEDAARLRKILVRLSGRQMKHKVESTAPALLAGLEKLLAIDDLIQTEDLAEILELARKVLPKLFRSG